ncbi:MAG: glycerophosphodiester phosphodiesterase [Afipia sp.]|nr:glycerophosphodiester phosphodiesterase [Afipia sp.]
MFARAPAWLTARPIAHRGLHDRSRGLVENMPSSIDAAVARNFGIEVDLQLSGDDEAMVHHDHQLGRLTEGSGDLLTKTAAELKSVPFKDTTDRMMTLGDLCDRVAGRVPLVLEVKSRFNRDRKLVTRMAEILGGYAGPAVAMSFDPDQVLAIRDLMPRIPRGVVAERYYKEDEWQRLPPDIVHRMIGLRHAFQTRPHFIAYWVNELPAPAPWIARNIFGCSLLTWTVRTPEQRDRASQYADQMIFEGFVPAD